MVQRTPWSCVIEGHISADSAYKRMSRVNQALLVRSIGWAHLTFEALTPRTFEAPCKYCGHKRPRRSCTTAT